MLTYSLIKNALIEISEVCQALWEENKDLQGRFVNDLTELQHIHSTINQLEIGHKYTFVNFSFHAYHFIIMFSPINKAMKLVGYLHKIIYKFFNSS